MRSTGPGIEAGEARGGRICAVLRALSGRLLAMDPPSMWTLTVDGALAGALMREGDAYRLMLVEGADRRLADLDGCLHDIDRVEQALASRLAGQRIVLRGVPA